MEKSEFFLSNPCPERPVALQFESTMLYLRFKVLYGLDGMTCDDAPTGNCRFLFYIFIYLGTVAPSFHENCFSGGRDKNINK